MISRSNSSCGGSEALKQALKNTWQRRQDKKIQGSLSSITNHYFFEYKTACIFLGLTIGRTFRDVGPDCPL